MKIKITKWDPRMREFMGEILNKNILKTKCFIDPFIGGGLESSDKNEEEMIECFVGKIVEIEDVPIQYYPTYLPREFTILEDREEDNMIKINKVEKC